MARAYVVAWEYQVKQGAEQKFATAYGAEGEWVALFKKATGFIRTELVRSEYDAHKFVTVDVWESRTAYDSFRKAFELEYDALDTIFQDLTLHEAKVGSFYLE